MSQELEFTELPELIMGIAISKDNEKPIIELKKKLETPKKYAY